MSRIQALLGSTSDTVLTSIWNRLPFPTEQVDKFTELVFGSGNFKLSMTTFHVPKYSTNGTNVFVYHSRPVVRSHSHSNNSWTNRHIKQETTEKFALREWFGLKQHVSQWQLQISVHEQAITAEEHFKTQFLHTESSKASRQSAVKLLSVRQFYISV